MSALASASSNFRTYFRLNTLPFWVIHSLCFAAFFVDFSWWYVALALGGYYVRMFFVTGVYHRYFSHKSYSTSRVFQFILAFCAMTSAQKGVLWWAAHHRHHHTHSDQEEDLHSPKDGFWWSHVGWILSENYNDTQEHYIRDLMRYPELLWLNKYHLVPIVAYGVLMFAIAGVPGLVWGLCISTVMLWHGTFTINSLSHVWGSRRYITTDTSRNNFILALVTLGEGWHNNHHRFQSSARNGFFWWEIDITYYVLRLLAAVGLIWNLRPVPEHLLDAHSEAWIKNASAYSTPAHTSGATAATTVAPQPALQEEELVA
jgi:stearoyl-CoA desaturase (delta-9 desaturase)